MVNSIIQAPLFFKLKFSPIWVSKKRNDKKINDLLSAETKLNFICLLYTKKTPNKYINKRKKSFFLEKIKVEDWTKNEKKHLFNCSRYSELEGLHNVNKKAR